MTYILSGCIVDIVVWIIGKFNVNYNKNIFYFNIVIQSPGNLCPSDICKHLEYDNKELKQIWL